CPWARWSPTARPPSWPPTPPSATPTWASERHRHGKTRVPPVDRARARRRPRALRPVARDRLPRRAGGELRAGGHGGRARVRRPRRDVGRRLLLARAGCRAGRRCAARRRRRTRPAAVGAAGDPAARDHRRRRPGHGAPGRARHGLRPRPPARARPLLAAALRRRRRQRAQPLRPVRARRGRRRHGRARPAVQPHLARPPAARRRLRPRDLPPVGCARAAHGHPRLDAVERDGGARGPAPRPHGARTGPARRRRAVRERLRGSGGRRARLARGGAGRRARRRRAGDPRDRVRLGRGGTARRARAAHRRAAGAAARTLRHEGGADRMSTATTSPATSPAAIPATRLLLRAGLLTLLALGGTFLLDPYRNYQLATAAGIFAAVAGLTLLVGLTGQLSLGHAVLMAAGGYGYALTATRVADALAGSGAADGVAGLLLPLLAGVVGALVASGALGVLLGLAAARLRGPYLAGLTLALVIALPSVAGTVPALAGAQGVSAPFVPVPDALAALIAVEQWHAWLAILLTSGAVTPLVALRAGGAGVRMRAVHDDETAARLAGIDPGRVKAGAFVASALAAGLGGAVLAVVTQQ